MQFELVKSEGENSSIYFEVALLVSEFPQSRCRPAQFANRSSFPIDIP